MKFSDTDDVRDMSAFGDREGFVGGCKVWQVGRLGRLLIRLSNSPGVACFRLGVGRLVTTVFEANRQKAPVVLTEVLSQARLFRGSGGRRWLRECCERLRSSLT